MHVLGIMGSPRKKGNTALAMGWISEALAEAGHRLEPVVMSDLSVKSGCVSCYKCQQADAPYQCAVKDDLNLILEKMATCDAVLLASPLYCWEFSAQIKPLIDRCFCLVKEAGQESHRSALKEKRLGLLVTCAGPIEHNADLILATYRRFCGYTLAQATGAVVVPFAPYAPPAPAPQWRDRARELALALAGGPAMAQPMPESRP